jgi:hypothetical protein
VLELQELQELQSSSPPELELRELELFGVVMELQ